MNISSWVIIAMGDIIQGLNGMVSILQYNPFDNRDSFSSNMLEDTFLEKCFALVFMGSTGILL